MLRIISEYSVAKRLEKCELNSAHGTTQDNFLLQIRCYDLFGRLDCWSWVWDMITGFILLFHQCTICEFAFLHLFVVVT